MQHEFVVPSNLAGYQVDRAIQQLVPHFSRRSVRRLLDSGQVYVNGRKERFASRKVQSGDRLSFSEPASRSQPQVRLQKSDILEEQSTHLVVNKPAGLLSQAGKDPERRHIVSELRRLYGTSQEYYLCHRLDLETSGVLLLGRSKEQTAFLSAQFKERQVRKIYDAIVLGRPQERYFQCSVLLSGIDSRTGDVRVVTKRGMSSNSRFLWLGYDASLGISWVRCYPVSGRSHQLRVHLQYLGLPIVGDKRYGNAQSTAVAQSLHVEHQLLHASYLNFRRSERDRSGHTVFAPRGERWASATKQLDQAIRWNQRQEGS